MIPKYDEEPNHPTHPQNLQYMAMIYHLKSKESELGKIELGD
mgnify:FL=1